MTKGRRTKKKRASPVRAPPPLPHADIQEWVDGIGRALLSGDEASVEDAITRIASPSLRPAAHQAACAMLGNGDTLVVLADYAGKHPQQEEQDRAAAAMRMLAEANEDSAQFLVTGFRWLADEPVPFHRACTAAISLSITTHIRKAPSPRMCSCGQAAWKLLCSS